VLASLVYFPFPADLYYSSFIHIYIFFSYSFLSFRDVSLGGYIKAADINKENYNKGTVSFSCVVKYQGEDTLRK